jgi:hypothetical protein
MQSKRVKIGLLMIALLLLGGKAVHAHQSELSNIMIFEQNGKKLLMIKSALTAFEGEVDFHYTKAAYKTPEAFTQLVINRFYNTCCVIINDDTIRLINPQVILGHETTVVAELTNMPPTINAFYIKNTFFEDMPSNQCALILTINDLPQKQFILNKTNNQEALLSVKNGQLIIENPSRSFFKKSDLLLWAVVLLFITTSIVLIIKKERKAPPQYFPLF